MAEKKIVICDIDGTIANNDHRQHFLEGKKDWDGFFSSLSEDKPIFEIINKINNLNFKGHKITFLTGRPEKYRGETKKWLNRFFSFKYCLIMRKDNDRRNKLNIKRELFDENFSKESIHMVFENDEQLIEMWKNLNLSVYEVSSYQSLSSSDRY